MKTFTVGINQKIVGKCDADRLSYSTAWVAATLSLAQLAEHIGAGHPWMPALLDKGQRRYQRYSNHAEGLALDIDSGMTIAQAMAHPVVSRHCGLAIESASSAPEHNKFRLVFVLPRAVEGHATIRICNQYLAHIVGSADRACQDASRYFFGAPGRKPFLLNESAVLPTSFVEDAIAWHAAAVAKAEAEAEANRQRWAAMPKQQSGDVVRDALSHIRPYSPGEGRYADLIPMIGGVLHEYGPEGEQMLREWDGGRGDWGRGGFDRILDSVRTSQPTRKATLGTLFYLAKQEGFRFPQRSWLDQIGDRLNRKPSPKKSAQSLKAALGDKPFNGYEYEPGQRAATWKKAIADGYRHILDLSGTGEGKSHTAGQLQPDDFGEDVKQLMYLSNGHYEPSTETLKGWPDMHGRHNGLTREATTGGSRLRRAKRGEERVVAANCSRNGVINALRAKNVSGADSASVVCGTCPLKDACSNAQGKGFGFLNQRKLALSSPRLRLHPSSAPGTDYDYDKVVAVWDEPSESFNLTEGVEVTADDVRQTAGHLAMTDPDSFDQLRPLLTAMGALFESKQGRYGIDHNAIMAALPSIPDDLDLEALKAALAPDLGFLDPEIEEGVHVSDMPGRSYKMPESQYGRGGGGRVNLRSHFSEDADAQAGKAETVIKQWLIDLVKVLQSGVGALHLSYETLTITRPNYRLRSIANATAGNLYLDATLAVDDLALMLGCEVDDIYVCRERPHSTGGNLNIRLYRK